MSIMLKGLFSSGNRDMTRRVLGICTYRYDLANLSYEEQALYREAHDFFDDVLLIDTRAVTYQIMRDEPKIRLTHHARNITDLSALIIRRTRSRQASTSLLANTLHHNGCRISEPPERFSSGSVSKLLQTLRIYKRGYGIDTFVAFDWVNGQALLERLDKQGMFPLIAKPVDGRQGQGIQILETLDEGLEYVETQMSYRADPDRAVYLQRLMDFRHEYRVFIAYGKPLGIAEKIRAEGKIVANASQGGKFIPADAPELIEIALRSVMPDCVYGVDIATDAENRPYIIETNRAPGFQAFENALGLNVARHLLSYLAEQPDTPERV
jgi:glutathione synthase/RimK-type ligase-like ATP-grasp enzyme